MRSSSARAAARTASSAARSVAVVQADLACWWVAGAADGVDGAGGAGEVGGADGADEAGGVAGRPVRAKTCGGAGEDVARDASVGRGVPWHRAAVAATEARVGGPGSWRRGGLDGPDDQGEPSSGVDGFRDGVNWQSAFRSGGRQNGVVGVLRGAEVGECRGAAVGGRRGRVGGAAGGRGGTGGGPAGGRQWSGVAGGGRDAARTP